MTKIIKIVSKNIINEETNNFLLCAYNLDQNCSSECSACERCFIQGVIPTLRCNRGDFVIGQLKEE